MVSYAPLLRRDQIRAALLHSVQTHPLTVLHAPTGYGKSTAAHELASSMRTSCFHTIVNPGETKAPLIWDSLTSQLYKQGLAEAAVWRSMEFPQNSIELRRMLEDMCRAFSGRASLWLIDDYHNTADPAFDAFIERLAREGFPEFSVLLLSRVRPAMKLEELVSKGFASEFGHEFLAFSEDETSRFFRLHGLEDPKLALRVQRLCEGWAVGIWLNTSSCLKHGAPAADQDIDRLIESIVYSEFHGEEQLLLLRLSFLDCFSGEQASFVADSAEAPEQLRRFHEKCAFIEYDPVARQYRFHSLLRSLLAKIAAADRRIDLKSLYRRAGKWFTEKDELLGAIHFFGLAGENEDYLDILRIFELKQSIELMQIIPDALVGLFAKIPAPVRLQCPTGCLHFVYAYLTVADPAKAAPLLFEAEALFSASDLPEVARRRAAGEILLMKSLLAFNKIRAMRELYVQAHTLLEGRSDISHRHLNWTFGCPHVGFVFLREELGYAELVSLMERDLRYYQDLGDGCSAGGQELLRAEYLLETGDLQKVERHLAAAQLVAEEKDQHSTVIAVHFTRARLLLAEGQPTEAAGLLGGLEGRIFKCGRRVLHPILDLALGYVRGCSGQAEDLPDWLRQKDITLPHIICQRINFTYVVFGKALLAQKEYARLESLARAVPDLLRPFDNSFGLLHARAMEAAAQYPLYGLEAALPTLCRAVGLAEKHRILLSLAEYGRHLLPLIETLCVRSEKSRYLEDLLLMTRHYARLYKSSSGTNAGGLTRREKEILHLVAKGKSNAGIARHLDISPNTVAKILNAAYRKLGAKNRTEAVRKLKKRTPGRE